MKILHLTNKPIFPLVDGGCIAMHEFLKNMLSSGFEVKNITITTEKHPFEFQAFPEKLQQIILPEAIFVDTRVRAKEAFLSLFTSKSYNVSRFYSFDFEKFICNYLNEFSVQLIVLESAYLLPYVTAIRKQFSGKIILRAHNVEFQIWQRLAKEENHFLKRKFLQKLAKDLKRYEISALKTVDGIATVSSSDLTIFRSEGIQTPIRCIPISFAFKELIEKPTWKRGDFFFLGAMNWKPNLEAVEVLIQTLFPAILEKYATSTLHLAGTFMPEWLSNWKHRNIQIHGKIENPADFMQQHGILLVPLKSGSGIRVKIVEAMSYGIPVIGSAIAFEGIPVTHKKNAWIAETSDDYLAAIEEFQSNPQSVEKIAEAGQLLVRTIFNESLISQNLLEFIESI